MLPEGKSAPTISAFGLPKPPWSMVGLGVAAKRSGQSHCGTPHAAGIPMRCPLDGGIDTSPKSPADLGLELLDRLGAQERLQSHGFP